MCTSDFLSVSVCPTVVSSGLILYVKQVDILFSFIFLIINRVYNKSLLHSSMQSGGLTCSLASVYFSVQLLYPLTDSLLSG